MYLTERAQIDNELRAFVEVLLDNNVKSFLEVGSKFGGSLWAVATSLPVGSKIVSVDLPRGTVAWEQSSKSLTACIDELKGRGYDAHLIWGNSTDPVIVEQVRKLGPYDAVFIDANHTMAYVRQDWANYGPMSRIVAFHDIVWWRDKTWKGVRIDVPQFWQHIKQSYEHLEFKFDPKQKDNGIGVLWRT